MRTRERGSTCPSLDEPDAIALEMVEDLRAVLEELAAIAADLGAAEDVAAT